jgi:nucleotide-binding universal stress UspA family protein
MTEAEGERMKTEKMKGRNILIAVDASDNAKRAVQYVRDFIGGLPGFHVTVLTIISEPSEDYFINAGERNAWVEKENAAAKRILDEYRQMLIQAGFRDEDVIVQAAMKSCASIAECILDEQRKLGCGTVVIGRRGISKKEEFMFGSTSTKILHIAKDCSIWVIE